MACALAALSEGALGVRHEAPPTSAFSILPPHRPRVVAVPDLYQPHSTKARRKQCCRRGGQHISTSSTGDVASRSLASCPCCSDLRPVPNWKPTFKAPCLLAEGPTHGFVQGLRSDSLRNMPQVAAAVGLPPHSTSELLPCNDWRTKLDLKFLFSFSSAQRHDDNHRGNTNHNGRHQERDASHRPGCRKFEPSSRPIPGIARCCGPAGLAPIAVVEILESQEFLLTLLSQGLNKGHVR